MEPNEITPYVYQLQGMAEIDSRAAETEKMFYSNQSKWRQIYFFLTRFALQRLAAEAPTS